MSLKIKLITTFVAISLVLSLLIVGVLSVRNLNLKIGGNIEFVAEGVEATISKGSLTPESSYNNSEVPFTEKMKEIIIRTDKKKSDIEKEFESWKGINLKFVTPASGEKPTIDMTFTITNDSSTDNLAVEILTNNGTGTNIDNVLITKTSGKRVIEVGGNSTYNIHFELIDPELSTQITNYSISIKLSKAGPIENIDTVLLDELDSYAGMTFRLDNSVAVNTLSQATTADVIGTAEVIKYDNTLTTADLEIPQYVQKGDNVYEVTSIYGLPNDQVIDMIINSTLTEQIMFSNESLTSVTLPISLRNIGSFAFAGCTKLTTLRLGDKEFAGDNITIVDYTNIGNKIFDTNNKTNLKSIGMAAFSDTAIKKMEIPEGVSELGGWLFGSLAGGESQLREILVPGTVKKMGIDSTDYDEIKVDYLSDMMGTSIYQEMQYSSPFAFCTALTKSILCEGIESIGCGTFTMCGIQNIVIPEGVQVVDASAFYECVNLESVVFPSTLKRLGATKKVFNVAWHTAIGFYSVFGGISEGCPKLNSITFNTKLNPETGKLEGVQTIGIGAFVSYIESSKVIKIPSTVIEFGELAIAGNDKIVMIDSPTIVSNYLTDVYLAMVDIADKTLFYRPTLYILSSIEGVTGLTIANYTNDGEGVGEYEGYIKFTPIS